MKRVEREMVTRISHQEGLDSISIMGGKTLIEKQKETKKTTNSRSFIMLFFNLSR